MRNRTAGEGRTVQEALPASTAWSVNAGAAAITMSKLRLTISLSASMADHVIGCVSAAVGVPSSVRVDSM